MTAIRTEVLVVGGGPAGATAAFQLARSGVAVTLVDRARFPRDKTCGESLSPGALARLEAIGMWRPEARTVTPSEKAPEGPAVIRGMRIRSPRGTTFVGRYRPGPAQPGLAIRRTVLDAELLARASGCGVRVLESVEAIAGGAVGTGAVVEARTTGTSTSFRIEASRVIVADGRRSFLARQLGFLDAESGRPGSKRYAVRAHCDSVSGLSDFAEMHVGQGGYCGLAPLSRTSANLCYVVFADRLDLDPRTIEDDFRRHLDRYPELARRLAGSRLDGAVKVVGPLRLTSRQQARGPFIAAGDTTGFLDPFTGEGIAHAVASGVLAADAVRRSLSGESSAFFAYEREVRSLRRIKGVAARVLHGLVSRPSLANSVATIFARAPRLGDAAVRLFGDQV